MKRRVAFWGVRLLGSIVTGLTLSCGPSDEEISRRLEQAERERDQLRGELNTQKAETEAHEQYLKETTQALNEIQDSIDKVGGELDLVDVTIGSGTDGDMVGASQRHQVLADIESIRTAVNANQKKLSYFEQKYQGSVAQVDLLKSLANRMQKTVNDQQQQLASMEQMTRALKKEITDRDQIILQKDGVIDEQRHTIQQIEANARIGYLLIGSVAELRAADMLDVQRNGFLGLRRGWRLSRNLDSRRELFKPIDTVQTTEFSIDAPSKSVEFLSSHPVSSYRLEPNGPAETILRIQAPEEFWQFRYAVVLVKRK